jgi:hypothetical protein
MMPWTSRGIAIPCRRLRNGAANWRVHGIIDRPAEIPDRDDGVALLGGQRKK